MRRDALLLAEIIDAAERIVELTSGASVEDLDGDRSRREALLWSFTVLGEASSQLDEDLKAGSPDVPLPVLLPVHLVTADSYDPVALQHRGRRVGW